MAFHDPPLHWDRNTDITIFSLYDIMNTTILSSISHEQEYYNMADDLLDGNEVVDYQEDSLTIKVD